MCLNGKCVSEHENAIDYGDGFLRRTGTAISSTFEKPNDIEKEPEPQRFKTHGARAVRA